MGSLERKQRLKDETRVNILEAVMQTVKEKGWEALSMRKIADAIEYTAPVIYEYFSSKEAILVELTRLGFLRLTALIEEATLVPKDAADRLVEMWIAYWNFAFTEKEYYKLMFGVNMHCAGASCRCPEAELPERLFKAAIKDLYPRSLADDNEIVTRYFTYWSVVHGLIALNMISKRCTNAVNRQILIDSIQAINHSISP